MDSNEPVIAFKEIEFIPTEDESQMYDAIAVRFSYTDGDGDLGRSYNTFKYPFHIYDAFVWEKDSVVRYPLTFVGTDADASAEEYELNEESKTGFQTIIRKNLYTHPEFADIPAFSQETACEHYRLLKVKPNSTSIIFPYKEPDLDGFFRDTFLVEKNEYYFNLHATFFTQAAGEEFKELIVNENPFPFCSGTFDSILPTINSTTKEYRFLKVRGNKNRGEITWHFQALFQEWLKGKKVKIRLYINDNALHKSNIIETDVLQF